MCHLAIIIVVGGRDESAISVLKNMDRQYLCETFGYCVEVT